LADEKKRGRPLGSKNHLHEKVFTEALSVSVNRIDADGKKVLYKLADRLVRAALEDGAGWAFAQIADRLEGKPTERIDHNIKDFRGLAEYSDAELTELLRERAPVAPPPIAATPRAEGEALN
jgi:hypothetical protein